jgi:hypothetical protein
MMIAGNVPIECGRVRGDGIVVETDELGGATAAAVVGARITDPTAPHCPQHSQVKAGDLRPLIDSPETVAGRRGVPIPPPRREDFATCALISAGFDALILGRV